jgi:hypothetical protein
MFDFILPLQLSLQFKLGFNARFSRLRKFNCQIISFQVYCCRYDTDVFFAQLSSIFAHQKDDVIASVLCNGRTLEVFFDSFFLVC